MGIMNYMPQRNNMNIDGIIEDYYVYAGENISAGDFVKYINGISSMVDYGTSSDTQLSNTNGVYIRAVELQNGSIFITYGCGSSGGGDALLHGMIVTVNGATINLGTETLLSNVSYSGHNADKPILLPNGNVFIAHGAESTSSVLYGLVCSISGTTITAGTDTKLNNTTKSGTTISATLLTNGDVFIAHSYNSNYLYGIVCSVSGTTITYGTDTQISKSSNSYLAMSSQTLSNGRVCIVHCGGGSSYNLYASICSVSSKAITTNVVNNQLSSTARTGQYLSSVLLENDRIFIAHSYSTSFYLYGMVISISGTTISAGTDTTLSANKTDLISTATLRNGNVFVLRSYFGNYSLTALIATINDKTITKGTETNLNMTSDYTGYSLSVLLLQNDTLLINHSRTSSQSLYGQIWAIDEVNNVPTNEILEIEYEQQVTLATKPPFDGIAKTSGVGGTNTGHNQQVKIARPLYIDNLVRNGDFSNSLEGWTDLNLNTSYPISWSINNDGLKFITNSNWTGIKTGKEQIIKSQIPAGHLFYASMSIKGSFSSDHSVVLAVANDVYASSVNVTNVSSTPSKVSLRYNSTYLYDRVQIWVRSVKSGDTATITDIKCYDLTAIFGKGNEPTKEWCDNNL